MINYFVENVKKEYLRKGFNRYGIAKGPFYAVKFDQYKAERFLQKS